jgi:hypothetical protein
MAKDARGVEFFVGAKVAKAEMLYSSDGLYVKEYVVTKINEDKVYLNDSRQPLRFPERVMIMKE